MMFSLVIMKDVFLALLISITITSIYESRDNLVHKLLFMVILFTL